MSGIDDFKKDLNEGNTAGQVAANAQAAGMPAGMNPQQWAAIQEAKAEKAKMDARPLELEDLKGKVDIKWFGHCGFKIHFLDAEEIHRNIYIDIWIDNKDCLAKDKETCPNDVDLALVTHGQLDHSMHAPFLLMAGKQEKRQIVASSEVGSYYELFRRIPPGFISKMQKGGTKDFGFAKVTMVAADHPSTCVGPQGVQITGGSACGFIVHIPNHNITFYHAGDTNVFSDMKLINDLYKPDVAFLPVGDCLGMGPREAAYAASNFLPNVHTFIPMSFNTFPVLTGTPEEFEAQCKEMGCTKTIIHPKEFYGGKPIVE